MTERTSELRQAAAAFGVAIGPAEAGSLVRLAELVVAHNEHVRLTAITEWAEVLAKHLLDSLAPLSRACAPRTGQHVVDLGSGGGFPGLVLAVVIPDASFTLIEATRKKAEFLVEAAGEMGLANVKVWPRRSEEAASAEGREAFDLVTARAVADLPVLVELGLPLLKIGGMLLAWKGPEGATEAAAAANALAQLGGTVEALMPYELPGGMGSRQLIAIRKTGPTPFKFPRRPGMAEKRPL